ncbi:alanine racemase [Cytobacillus kochii]|uniref:alanine racemase n=1 Tax=Cytobacillus kochii TaxID=859143 RepID=UPI001CD6C0AC|nr:alanine racemase [Cytobacillus kochii]MCA1027926.1 alanine racemase [Cytobacillus kochii]MCM3323837.1 alanine racemase [Cytobacillus kochii]MCM3346234.1 alanine racemase [Cytobacillus kochii]
MNQQVPYFRDTWAEINLDYITYNVESMIKHIGEEAELFAVVKANAYGHGDIEVAKTALKAGATYLAVATLDEAFALRNKGIDAPILVLGLSRPEDVGLAEQAGITLTVCQAEWLMKAAPFINKEVKVHVKMDSGMGRLGIKSKEEWGIFQYQLQQGKFHVEGVFTHFATADELETAYFNEQLSTFNEMISWMDEQPRYIHASNSAAGLRHPEAKFNAVRFGISMYGMSPSSEIKNHLPFKLKEAFSLHTKIVHVKKLLPGEKVSYGATYEAEKEESIGTLPIGYADGWIRRLATQEVLVNGRRVSIVGRICMDQCMIRISEEEQVGDVVTLIGTQNGQTISVDDIANTLETINYEVTCQIGMRIPRIYIQDQTKISTRNGIL